MKRSTRVEKGVRLQTTVGDAVRCRATRLSDGDWLVVQERPPPGKAPDAAAVQRVERTAQHLLDPANQPRARRRKAPRPPSTGSAPNRASPRRSARR